MARLADDTTYLLVDFELDKTVFINLRRDLESSTHIPVFKTLNGPVGDSRPLIHPGGKGDIFRHHNGGLFIVQSHKLRRGNNIEVIVRLGSIYYGCQIAKSNTPNGNGK